MTAETKKEETKGEISNTEVPPSKVGLWKRFFKWLFGS